MRAPRLAVVFVLASAAGAAACGANSLLPAAHAVNVVDTVTLWAIDGTPPATPSAFDLLNAPPQPVRTDQTTAFDFAFNLDTAGRALLLPAGALHIANQAGIRLESTTFDAVTDAPTSGYADSTAQVVEPGTVAVIRSRPQTCSVGIVVFLYAKLQVLAIDATARTITFQILVDQNCGYRGLQPGIPSR